MQGEGKRRRFVVSGISLNRAASEEPYGGNLADDFRNLRSLGVEAVERD